MKKNIDRNITYSILNYNFTIYSFFMDSQIVSDPRYSNGSGDGRVFDSWNEWPKVLIVSGVHGNETWPMQAVSDLLKLAPKANDLTRWSLIVVAHGNPDAVAAWKRDLNDKDLNRYFGDISQGTIDAWMMEDVEARRAMFLKGVISGWVEYVLDLHSLSWESRVPFLYCPDDAEKIDLARKLWVSHIVIGWAKLAGVLRERWIVRPLRPWLADYANMQKWVIGLTFEAGTHDSPDARANTRKFLANALSVLGMDTDNRIDRIGWDETVLIDMIDVYLWNSLQDVQFEWVIKPVNFMQFSESTLVAQDHGQDVYMEAGTILVQPKAVSAMKPWQEAFFIGRRRQ